MFFTLITNEVRSFNENWSKKNNGKLKHKDDVFLEVFMGVFGELLGGLAKGAFDALKEAGANYQKLKSKYESYSNEELKDVVRSSFSSQTEKSVALAILKDRGVVTHIKDCY